MAASIRHAVKLRRILYVTVLLALHQGGAGSASQPSYVAIDIGFPGYGLSVAHDINKAGDVVGNGTLPSGDTHAFLWRFAANALLDLGTLGGGSSLANGMNDLGQVVGRSQTADGRWHAVLYDVARGGLVDLHDAVSFGGAESSALQINNAGQIVGGAEHPDGSTRAFLFDLSTNIRSDLGLLSDWGASSAFGINDGGDIVGKATTGSNEFRGFRTSVTGASSGAWAITDVWTLGGQSTTLEAVSNAGIAVGTSELGDGRFHAIRVRLKSDAMSDLGTLGGANSAAYGVSGDGTIVGQADRAMRGARAFVSGPTGMRDLNDSIEPGTGWILTRASAINDAGVIAGDGLLNGARRAYVLVPASLKRLPPNIPPTVPANPPAPGPPGGAQGQPTLISLVTNSSPLDLASSFGSFDSPAANQSGDVAFRSGEDSALFLRPVGSAQPLRILQQGDRVPGLSDGVVESVGSPSINSTGFLAFGAFFVRSGGNHGAVIVRDPSGSLNLLARTGPDTPFSGVRRVTSNEANDVVFELLPRGVAGSSGPTVFLAPGGSAPVRIVGPGDAAPGTTGTLTAIVVLALNNAGEVLFRASLVGGPPGTGLFVGSPSGVRKIVAPGDAAPTASFASIGSGFLNDSGEVAFTALGTGWVHTPANGVRPIATAPSAAPAAIGGSLSGYTVLGMNNSGQLALSANVSGSVVTNLVLLRHTPGRPLETVAHRNQAIPGASQTFQSFSPVILHGSGRISFLSALSGGGTGLFQQSSSAAIGKVALLGDPAPLDSGGRFGSLTIASALDTGAILFRSAIFNGSAFDALFLGSAGNIQPVASTDDALPAGSRVSLRTIIQSQRGDYSVFRALRSGGKVALWRVRLSDGQLVRIVGDGDSAPATSGGRIAGLSQTSVFVNAAGCVAFSSGVRGGTAGLGTGVFFMEASGLLRKIVASNDVDPATGRTFEALTINLSLIKPSALNDLGHVVFRSRLTGLPTIDVAIFRYVSPGPPVKVVAIGDAAPLGGTFVALNVPTMSQVGHLTFTGTRQAGSTTREGVYIVPPGSAPQVMVEESDLAPGGGTFYSVAPTTCPPTCVWGRIPSINDLGQVAFKARLNGGGAGVFVGSLGGALQEVARHGESSPVGGTFNLAALVDSQVLINNQGEVVFRSDLSGGPADSGYFIRRGNGGPVTGVAFQGQTVPGMNGVFHTIATSVSNVLAEQFDLDDAGRVLFANRWIAGETSNFATFAYSPDGKLSRIVLRGDPVGGSGGGSVLIHSDQGLTWAAGGRYAFWARITGSSTFEQAIVVTK